MNNETLSNKLKKNGFTDFEVAVYLATTTIPAGQTKSYKDIAEKIGRPKSYRAVGSALKRNPYPHPGPIPCHRVISSSGKIGGFMGKTDLNSKEIRKKIRLLKQEKANQ